jgi:hypothetical protein
MKSASELLDDFLKAVKPPRGCAITLRERRPQTEGDTNWIASFGIAPWDVINRFDAASAELRRRHSIVDWSGITTREGRWRLVSKHSSEKH